MQSTAGDIAGGGGGGIFSTERGRAGVGVGGAGLSRFRSAPATWLDALLDDDLTRDDPLRFGPDNNTNHSHSGSLTQLLASGTTTTTTNPSPLPASSSLARSNSTSSYNIPATAPATANAHDPAGFFDPPSDGGAGGASGQLSHASGLDSFYRMNSSPADFLSGSVDGYFSSFGGFSSNYELMGATQVNNITPSGKRMREGTDNELHSPSKLSSSPLKREHSSGASSLLDIEMDKLFEDSVPCRVRAKRGCATHPRSIAERVRRTKISDRIRRLQELVPNMDKQTNTADMLEEAVEYVKVLQKQIEDLTENQKRCTCAAKNHHLL